MSDVAAQPPPLPAQVPAELPGGADVQRAVEAWLDRLHAWLDHNHRSLADLRLRRGRLRLGTVDRVGRFPRPAGQTRQRGRRGRRVRRRLTPSGALAAAAATTSRRASWRLSG